jgi:hypothetical protein
MLSIQYLRIVESIRGLFHLTGMDCYNVSYNKIEIKLIRNLKISRVTNIENGEACWGHVGCRVSA